MSTVKVQTVAPVDFKFIRCHQIKKRHHIWLLLSKIFTDSEKVVSLKWRCPPWEDFHWWRGEHSAYPSVRPTAECSVGLSPGQEGIILRVKWQTQDFWSQQKQTHIDYQAHLDQVQGKLWCSLSLQESAWYEEALWEESISSHHVLGPLDDLLFLQQLQLPAGPKETRLLPVWTEATRSQSWSPSGSWGDPASLALTRHWVVWKPRLSAGTLPQGFHKPKPQCVPIFPGYLQPVWPIWAFLFIELIKLVKLIQYPRSYFFF